MAQAAAYRCERGSRSAVASLHHYIALHQLWFTKPVCHHTAGELLPHRFTFASIPQSGTVQLSFFSVALSCRLPGVAVNDQYAL